MRFRARSTGPSSRPRHTAEPRVDWSDRQRRARERHWPDVERLIGALRPRLFQQAKLLEYDLALRYSDTGQFRDVFLGVDQFPVLSIGGWLLDDLDVTGGPERDVVERQLFLASVLIVARADAIERIADPASFYDHEHLALIAFLSERVALELARVVPPGSAFWREHDAISTGQLEAVLEQLERDRDGTIVGAADAPVRGRWSAPARLLASAAMALAHLEERADEWTDASIETPVGGIHSRVITMLDDLAAAFQIRSDLAAMHHDLQRGRATYPILEIARAARIPLRPWPKPDVLLGAMVVTGSLGRILDQALGRVRDAHRTAAELGLATFTAYLGDAEAAFEERARMAGAGMSQPAPAPGRGKSAAPLITAAEPTVPKALAMAQGFLLSDLTFKESWETHREGMFGSSEVASRFPAGMILEIMCRHGHALSEPVDAFLSFTAANGFRYYDHPWSGVDADTVGVFLRLQPNASGKAPGTAALDGILGCLEREVRTSGAVPVWITTDDEPEPSRPPILALGDGCGTVAAHLLLGLDEVAPDRYADTIETGAAHLLDRIADVGLGANVDYPPIYALAIFARLIAQLEGGGFGADLASKGAAARRALRVALGEASQEPPRTAQRAALLTIACLEMDEPERIDPRWIGTMLKAQRFDGSWAGEPFAAAPNRGGSVTWYSSATLTSALCYDALARHRRWSDETDSPGRS